MDNFKEVVTLEMARTIMGAFSVCYGEGMHANPKDPEVEAQLYRRICANYPELKEEFSALEYS